MTLFTETELKKFVTTLESLLEIVADHSDINTLSSQLKTFLKLRHDFWVGKISQELKTKHCSPITEPIIDKLTPDIVCTKNNTRFIVDVTFTYNHNLIKEKKEKYSSLVSDYSHVIVIDYNTSGEEFFDLQECKLWKKKFIALTDQLLKKFLANAKKIGITSEMLREVEELHYMGLYKEDYSIKFTRKMKSVDAYLPRDKRETLPLDEKIDIITNTIKSLLTNHSTVADKYKLETMKENGYQEAYDECIKDIERSYSKLNVPKASFLMYTPIEVANEAITGKWKTEQDLLLLQINLLSNIDFPMQSLFKSFQNSLKHTTTRSVFNTSVPLPNQQEPDMRKLYQDYYKQVEQDRREDSKDAKLMTFIEFCLKDTTIDPQLIHSKTRKTLSATHLDDKCQNFLKLSKTNMSKAEYIEGKLSKSQAIKSGTYKIPILDPSSYDHQIERYIKVLTQETNKQIPEELLRMLYKPGSDAPLFSQLKESAVSDFRIFLNALRFTPLLSHMIDTTRHLSQLLHFQNLVFKHDNFSLFNSGIPNTLYLVQHGIQDRGRDVGRAYLIIKFGSISQTEKELFGFVSRYKSIKTEIHMTKWRRLNSQRIGFHLDQVYSVISTTFASFQRRLSESRTASLDLDLVFAETKVIFAMRYLVSISHRQLFAEMLSDIRYLYMDAFSEFADCKQFIGDKYVKPIQTHFEVFLIKMLPKFENFRKEFQNSGVVFKSAAFVGASREDYSLGGKINLRSILYPGVRIRSIQDLLDDMFLYVHTNKDPSTPYHEYVKAFNTIVKYQEKYNSLSYNRKKGLLQTEDDVVNYLNNDNGVGFWSLATNAASELLCGRFDSNIIKSKIKNILRDDTLLNMNSTKSIIPEREREVHLTEYDDIFTSQFTGFNRTIRKKTKDLWETIKKTDENPYLFTVTTKKNEFNDKLVVLSGTNRCKVHDSTKDIIENTKLRTTMDLALWNINSNHSRVATDICIKAQYGAKREFYVINHGAKAMARVVEQTFKVICGALEEEMISVSGDKKMYNIQNLLDRALLNTKGENKKIYYCNGDCTKWSAAETMECLLKFTQGCKSLFDDDHLALLEEILMAWGNKDIFVPSELMKNVFFDLPGVTENLKNPVYKSTQNFLQGMFNYLSSSKAVACSELTREIWKRLYPEDDSELYHMEHSDDYAFIFITSSSEKFALFKQIHRIVMRMLGISDSTKKTNCQQFLLEFISLISFNGVMVYPQIKKIKEVGLNIGCLGYASDIMTTCSRVGEACRMGVPADVAYIMGRIQNVRIASAYGLFTANNDLYYNKEYIDMGWTSIPVQLWGIPDVHPMFYLFSKGDPNNHRLYKYEPESRKLIDTLYVLGLCENLINEEEYQEDRIQFTTGLFHPNYNYLRNSKLLSNIRKKLTFSLEDSQKYWEEHPLDLLTKPKNPNRYYPWVLSKYYQKSFGEAYMRQGRVQLMLRLSHFVKQKCLTLNLNIEKLNKHFSLSATNINLALLDDNLTILECAKFIIELSKVLQYDIAQDKLFQPMLFGFDQTSKYIYTHFSFSRLQITGKSTRNTKAYPEPTRKFEFSCVNDPIKVLQYIVSPDDFLSDNASLTDVTTFIDDVSKIKTIAASLKIDLNAPTIKDINIVAEIALTSRGGGKPMLLNFNPSNDLLTSIVKYVESQSISGRYCTVETGLYEEFTPKQDSTLLEDKLYTSQHPLEYGWEMQTPELLNDICMLLTFCSALNIDEDIAINIISNAKFSLDEQVTALDYIKRIGSMYVSNQLKVTNSQTQMICALCDFIEKNPLPLMKYLDTKLGYKYEYRQSTPKKGMTTVNLITLGESFQLVFNETKGKPGHNLTIITNSKKLHLLPVAYLTGLRLMGSISINEFLKRMNRDTLQYVDFHEPLKGVAKGKNLYVNPITNQYSFTQNLNVDKIFPVILTDKLIMSMPSEGDDIHKLLLFDYKNLSAYSGKAKVFTLQVKHLVQFNCWKSTAKLEEFQCNFLLQNNVMKKILNKEYDIDSTAFFNQSLKSFEDKIYIPKNREKTKFRLHDEQLIKVQKENIEKKLLTAKQLINPMKYGTRENIYFEDIMKMDSKTATEYAFGTSDDNIPFESTKRVKLDEGLFDDVLDFDIEIDEDNFFGGGFGEYDTRFDTYNQIILDESQKIFSHIRQYIRSTENVEDILSKFGFLTTDKNIDSDINDSRYKGVGINKVLLCDAVAYGLTLESVIQVLEAKNTIEAPKEIVVSQSHSFFNDSDFFSDEETKESEPPQQPLTPSPKQIDVIVSQSHSFFNDSDFFSDEEDIITETKEDIEDVKEESKIKDTPDIIVPQSHSFFNDSDFFSSDDEDKEPSENILTEFPEINEKNQIPDVIVSQSHSFFNDSDFFSDDEEVNENVETICGEILNNIIVEIEKKQSQQTHVDILVDQSHSFFNDSDFFSDSDDDGNSSIPGKAETEITPELSKEIIVSQAHPFFNDDDFFSDTESEANPQSIEKETEKKEDTIAETLIKPTDVIVDQSNPFFNDLDFFSDSEEETVLRQSEDIIENPVDASQKVVEIDPYKEYYMSFLGVFDNPLELLKFIEPPAKHLSDYFPGPNSAYPVLRYLEQNDPITLFKYFPKNTIKHPYGNMEYKLNEQTVVHEYGELGMYNVAADMKFRYHATNQCNCKVYKSKYSTLGTKICSKLPFHGRNMLICEYFFDEKEDALEAFISLENDLGKEKFNEIFRLDYLSKQFPINAKTLDDWINSRYFTEPQLLEDIIEQKEIIPTDTPHVEDLDIYDQPIISATYASEMKHPSNIDTADISRKTTEQLFTGKKPYTLLEAQENISNFPIQSMIYTLIGRNRFNDLTNYSKLQCIEILYRLVSNCNTSTLRLKFMNKVLELWDMSIMPNTTRREIGEGYYHAVVEQKTVIYKKMSLPVHMFESLIVKLSEIEHVVFIYNPNDTVDVFTPTNEVDIKKAHALNIDILYDYLGPQCEIGNEIQVINKEMEYINYLDLLE